MSGEGLDNSRNVILINKVLTTSRVSAAAFSTDMAFWFLVAPPLSLVEHLFSVIIIFYDVIYSCDAKRNFQHY